MADLGSVLGIENADINVSSNVNFTFDWGTIGIIVGSVVALLAVIFAIAFFCGRGCGLCVDNICCKVRLKLIFKIELHLNRRNSFCFVS
jgi:hypothetical protein